jgi:hypothetical protein
MRRREPAKADPPSGAVTDGEEAVPGRTGAARERVDAAVDVGSQQGQGYCPECGQVVARFGGRVCYHSRWDYDQGHTAWCDGSDPGTWGLEDDVADDGP